MSIIKADYDWERHFGFSREDVYETLFGWLPQAAAVLGQPEVKGTLIDYIAAQPHPVDDETEINGAGLIVMEENDAEILAITAEDFQDMSLDLDMRPSMLLLDITATQPSDTQSGTFESAAYEYVFFDVAENGEPLLVFSSIILGDKQRGKGLGKTMVQAVLRTALMLGCKKLHLGGIMEDGVALWLQGGALLYNRDIASRSFIESMEAMGLTPQTHAPLFELARKKTPKSLATLVAYVSPGGEKIGHAIARQATIGDGYVSFTNPYCLKHLKDHLGFDVAAERKLLAARPGFKPRGPALKRREP